MNGEPRITSGREFKPINQDNRGEEWFRLLLETLPHIAFVIAPGGQAEYYNARFIDYLGFRPGADRESRTALHHPEDQALLNARRTAGAAFHSEYIVEARIRRHDGDYRWHRIHNMPLIREGQAVAWLGTAVDIHDVVLANDTLEHRVRQRTLELEAANEHLAAEIRQRERTEEGLRDSEVRYRTLYNRTPMALQSVDAKARLIDVNDTWCTMFGYDRQDAIGRSPANFMTPESAEKYLRRAWPNMLESQGDVRTEDYRFVTRSGRVFDGRLAASGEFDAEGRFIRSWSAISDITAERQAAKELQQAQRMEAVGQLTAGIAHDFNNLLTAVLGNLEMLSKPARDSARAERLITGARAAAQRGARLTAQLLAFSRQQRIIAEHIDVNLVIRGMLPLLESTIGPTTRIVVVEAVDLWPALADPTQLELAVLNLTINARDAMAGGGTITIVTRNASRGGPGGPEEPMAGDYVEVAVSDTGPGISDAVRERIFDPFFTTKEIGKGSGLGLSQVLGVVKQLGGGIAVSSVPNEMTHVSIFLPRTEPGAAAATDNLETNVMATNDTQNPGVHIFIVDDDLNVRTITADILRDAGYMVAEAGSGTAALEMLEQSDRPALILADVAMPGMNGVEFAMVVRRSWPGVPVLFMTGYAGSNLLPMDSQYDVLNKPFPAAELISRVERAIKRRGSAD